VPSVLALVVIAPWFVYQSLQPSGREFWNILVGIHVYTRLTGVLIPDHLGPWHHYFTMTWREFRYAHAVMLVTAGLGVLVYVGWRRNEWLARLVFLWFAIPYAIMSLGTSKLLHYAFPFIAPLALGAGLVCALGYRALTGPAGERLSAAATRWLPAITTWRERRGVQIALVSIGVVLLGLGIWTALRGPVVFESDGIRWFRNSSVVRPLVFAALAVGLTAGGTRVAIGVATALVLLMLPLDRYFENVRLVASVRHPMRTIRDCTVEVQRTVPGVAPGVLRATGEVLHHAYYFYMRHTGGWLVADPPAHTAAIRDALDGPHRPVLVTRAQQRALWARGEAPPGVLLEDDVAMLLPGPFAVCVPRALAVGGRPIPETRTTVADRR
jgi:hypothetical protein